MPPLIWCGYCRTRISGAVMRTLRSSSTACFSPACDPGWRSRSTSVAWSPMVNSGSSEVIGFCRIIARSRPRIACICAADSCIRGCPSKTTSPLTRALSGSERISALHMVDFPLPDSPTTPTISPRSTWKLAPATAATGLPRGPNSTLSARTLRSDMLLPVKVRCADRAATAACRPAR